MDEINCNRLEEFRQLRQEVSLCQALCVKRREGTSWPLEL